MRRRWPLIVCLVFGVCLAVAAASFLRHFGGTGSDAGSINKHHFSSIGGQGKAEGPSFIQQEEEEEDVEIALVDLAEDEDEDEAMLELDAGTPDDDVPMAYLSQAEEEEEELAS